MGKSASQPKAGARSFDFMSASSHEIKSASRPKAGARSFDFMSAKINKKINSTKKKSE